MFEPHHVKYAIDFFFLRLIACLGFIEEVLKGPSFVIRKHLLKKWEVYEKQTRKMTGNAEIVLQ